MKNKHGGTNQQSVLIISGIGLIALAAVLLISLMLQGETKYSGEGSGIATTGSITCINNDAAYSFRTAPGVGNMKMHVVLNNDKLATVSLVYRLYYDDHSVIDSQKTKLNADMNKAFAENGLGADALNAVYSSLDDSVQMTLYAEKRNINSNTAKFFLLEDVSGDYEKDEIMRIYSEKGFDCTLDE